EAKKEFKKLADLEKEITELVTLYYSIMLKGLTHKGQTSVGKNNRLMNYMAYFPWEEIFDSEKHKREIAYMELVFTSLRAYGNQSGRTNTIDLVKNLLEHIEQDKIETLKKYKSIIKKISPIELEKLVNIGAKTLGYEDLTQGERLQAASDFFLTILEMVLEKNDINFPVEDLESLKNIINSKLNNDNPRLVSELLKAAGRHIDRAAKNANDSKKSVKNLSSLMNALTIYTETYSNDDDKLKNIRAARKLVLENLMDEAADREGRYGENIWSLGINVGFNLGGYQGTWNGEHTGYTPQLSLPLGIYFQTMPGHDSYCGFHMGLFFFDLAQYANYHPTEGINQPAWNTAFTVGFQIGLIIGKPRYLFNIGLDVRYSPAIFFSKDSNTSSTNPGGLRAGIYAQYYVSFFDFN
ncbi:MAG: hypothetical protein GY754_38320, partial [bacterium]|nr:hypothetical protein [bacterium]